MTGRLWFLMITKATTYSDDREITVVVNGSMFVSKHCSSSTPYRAFSFYYDWIGEMIGDGDHVSSGLFINGLVALHCDRLLISAWLLLGIGVPVRVPVWRDR
jgi:hypothetical protein